MPGIRQSVEWACTCEVLARKPGNVYPGREFNDLSTAELLLAGLAIAPVLENTKQLGVGAAILQAVRAAKAVSQSNANLGIILLLAPLTAADADSGPTQATTDRVLQKLSIHDAQSTYQAIRESAAGGLGQVDSQDIQQQPTVNLRDAMRLARDRDSIARIYSDGFAELFDVGVPSLAAALAVGCGLEEAIIWCHLQWLAHHPDTLIARKLGQSVADEATCRAQAVLAALQQPRVDQSKARTPQPGFQNRPEIASLDDWLRDERHQRNPGTTADLVAASLYIAIRTRKLDPVQTPWRTP